MIDIPMVALPGGAARIVRWLRAPGEAVAAGDPLLIALTDRVEAALPAPDAGVLAEALVAEGETVEFGAVLARMRGLAPEPPPPDPPRIRATPVARRIAARHGIDIAAVPGSGPRGGVRKADVLALIAPPGTEPAVPVGQQVENGRREQATPHLAPARRFHPPAPSIPVALTAMQADMGAVAAYIAAQGGAYARRGLHLNAFACVAFAVAAALPHHPSLNARWCDDGIIVRRRLHLAVEEAGQSVVVRDAGDLTLRGIVRALSGPPAEEERLDADATFTLTGADEGAWLRAPTVPPGQSARLSAGALRRQPLVVAGSVAVRPILVLTLAYDARILDQRQADAFLADVRRRLETFMHARHPVLEPNLALQAR